jgi:hypothetical protein
MMMRRVMTLVLALGLVPVLGACNRGSDEVAPAGTPAGSEATNDQAVRVAAVGLGRSIDAQGRFWTPSN